MRLPLIADEAHVYTGRVRCRGNSGEIPADRIGHSGNLPEIHPEEVIFVVLVFDENGYDRGWNRCVLYQSAG
jgi:hypothetical protein